MVTADFFLLEPCSALFFLIFRKTVLARPCFVQDFALSRRNILLLPYMLNTSSHDIRFISESNYRALTVLWRHLIDREVQSKVIKVQNLLSFTWE